MFVPFLPEETSKKLLKTDFSGGMSRRGDPVKGEDNQYPLLKNGRIRYGNVKPVNEPAELLSQVPAGLIQGHYTMGNLHIVFIAGEAYFKDYSGVALSYNKISGFLMNPTAPVIYAQLIPATGTITSIRKSDSAVEQPEDIIKALRTSAIYGAPQCLLCQDGLSQPRIILPDGSHRVVQDISQWNLEPDINKNDRQEYVPIGKQMVLAGGILYIASPDGSEIYRSVSGRPLDFVIAVDNDGDKLQDSIQVEASRLSYKVAIETVTCLGEINTNDGSFYVSTAKNSYILTPDFNRLAYGEPIRFNRASIGDSGALNQFSFLGDVLGDSVFIDQTGMRSFNSIYQTKFRGENTPFSANVFRLFESRIQNSSLLAVAFFDNYALFSMDTVYGNVVLVYDTLLRQYVALDKYNTLSNNQAIKQFAVINVNNRYRLFFSTSDNRLFEAFASDELSTCELYVGDWAGIKDVEAIQLLPKSCRIVFVNTRTAGQVNLTEYVDGAIGRLQSQDVIPDSSIAALSEYPRTFPWGTNPGNFTDNVVFDLEGSDHGWKLGLHISFNFDAELCYIDVNVDQFKEHVSSKQMHDNISKFRRI